MYYLGIDLGTSAVKAILMSAGGAIVRQASCAYPISYPQAGWSEQNPEDWWQGCVRAIRETCTGVDPASVRGIAVSGQMHGLVTLDAENHVVRPAILWNDGRSEKEVQYLNQTIGKARLIRETGNIAYAGFTAPKILWMQAHEPDLFAKVRKILLPKDYIVFRLTGRYATDYSDASGMLLLDVQHKRWSPDMLAICRLREGMLPQIYESYAVVGSLRPALAEELGLLPSCRVMAGAGDNAGAAIGTATVGNAACNISLGTSGTLFISSESYQEMSRAELHSFAHADGRYHLMGVILSAASCSKWWMKHVIESSDYAREESGFDLAKDDGVYFLPYLMGERSPHNDTAVRGAFVGLSMSSTRKDMTRAILEGVAFALRDCLELARSKGLNVRRSKICGGGSRSEIWKEIVANVLNLDLEEPEVEEGPSYGAAILAAVGDGAFPSVQEAVQKLVSVRRIIRPQAELVALYDAKYAQYKRLYPMLAPFYRAKAEAKEV